MKPDHYRGFPRYTGPDQSIPHRQWSTDTDWQDAAACRGMSSQTFFPERGDMAAIRQAKQVCNGCPARVKCLEVNLDEVYGIFGGLTPNERQRVRGRRRRSA